MSSYQITDHVTFFCKRRSTLIVWNRQYRDTHASGLGGRSHTFPRDAAHFLPYLLSLLAGLLFPGGVLELAEWWWRLPDPLGPFLLGLQCSCWQDLLEDDDPEWLGGDLLLPRCGDELLWSWWGRPALEGEELDVRGKDELRGEALGLLRGTTGLLGGVFGLWGDPGLLDWGVLLGFWDPFWRIWARREKRSESELLLPRTLYLRSLKRIEKN